MQYKLGKAPATKNSIPLRLRDYLSLSALPSAPETVSNQHRVQHWQMLGNDQYGDCVWAGAGHETMLWDKDGGKYVVITDQNVLSDYAAVTGFNPHDPSTDQGTSVETAARYREQMGVVDNAGRRHRVAAYTALTPGNYEELKQAIYLFEAIGLGWEFPQSAMEQFNRNQPWKIVAGSPVEGGHYTPVVGYDPKYVYVVTWGRVQAVEWAFLDKYMDEGIVYFSEEMLANGKTIEGFNATQLKQDFSQL